MERGTYYRGETVASPAQSLNRRLVQRQDGHPSAILGPSNIPSSSVRPRRFALDRHRQKNLLRRSRSQRDRVPYRLREHGGRNGRERVRLREDLLVLLPLRKCKAPNDDHDKRRVRVHRRDRQFVLAFREEDRRPVLAPCVELLLKPP